ncbi:related to ARG81 - transcription factor involved in arginine metabolism [Fusarium torulosum]|uniref:Related to ARG81 - transcription factor involved in arginine metabolism n=1 Tax=Fusarium torulosum TaxID=33205 RepID=A0AAE8SE44_9HYPO|nr:related to ARG81 - transcription factor involved in arginine metabolism [Fusarium torulosum]
MPKQTPAKVERTRTFTGCRTCRSRHAKCDEAQPECGTCKRLGLTCGGYGARLFWISDDGVRPELQQSHRGSEYRYPLFSESQRRLMSAELADSLGRRTAASLLADIDSACERLNAQDDGSSLVKGPFGVFQSVEEPMTLTLDTIECSPDTNTDNTSGSMYPETDGFIEDIQRSDWPDQLPGDDMDIFTASLDPTFDLNHDDATIPDQIQMHDPSMANFFIDDPTAAEGLAIFSPGFISQVIGYDTSADTEENLHPAFRHPMSEMVPYPRDIPHGHSGLPEEAEPLLRHYRQTMAGQRSTMQAKRKSPWEIIFLPCALETFAELSLWNEASHTRSTIFYTLLAHSALQLHMLQKPNALSTNWKEIGLRNHERAQSHLRQALQHEMFGPKQASYKELLMAILAMAMTSLHNGARAFRIFLLDAERLIRLRGLANQKPFKTRLLHHMYTHLRVIAESMSLCNEALPECSMEVQDHDMSQGRTFRITEEGLNMGLDPALEKTDEIGYSDIHLEVQGQWSHTLYPVIYGIPESLMTLLSQTVSLSNEKNRLETVARCNPGISEALAKHTKTLENRIWAWTSTLDPSEPTKAPTEANQDLLTHPQVRSMTLAIHQALIIYFYRRVYDMNAMILQDLVKKTLDYLEPCLSELIEDQDFATSLAWPAFVAACEAVSPELQERALRCLGITDDKGVYFTPKPAKAVVPLIWDKRKESGDWTTSWQSLVLDSLS